ncbi:hypothetical protein GGR55DRAFT_666149 [Xylaria sp. FL0064]|nr:hypothetical protein GGR55DRAFT_666149 [Xylaria sp. FL0064]
MVTRGCSGVLPATKLPVHFEGVRRLSLSTLPSLTIPSHQHLAQALVALSRVLSKEHQSTTIQGGYGACWVAAVAEYLYGLSVTVTGNDGVDLLYSTGTGTESRTRSFSRILHPRPISLQGDCNGQVVLKSSLVIP